MKTIREYPSVGDPDKFVQSAPWPALLVTGDGRILRWNAPAGAALDPLTEGLEGLRLTFALEDQGLSGAADLRIGLPHDPADPDQAAEIILLDLDGAKPDAALGAGLTGVLGDAAAEVADMIVGRSGLEAAASLSRAVAAVLAAEVAPTADAAGARCDVSAVAAKVLETWRPRFAARRRNLSITIDCETPEEAAIPDAALIDSLSAVFELISGDAAFGDVSVRVGPDADGTSVRMDIAVRSAGGVVSPAALDLVAALARLHVSPYGGDATLAATGPGDAMALRLRTPSETRPKQRAVKVRPDLPDLSHVSILMAEDNLTNQLVAAEMLKSMNATIAIASDGAEALEMIDGRLFDLLLVDIEMPRVSGLEVISRVRARGGPQAARPIVALTAYAMNEHRARIMEAGADGLIPKPILSIEQFGRSILDYLDAAGAALAPVVVPEATAAAAPEPATTQGPTGVVDMVTYDALTEAIGPDATVELLEKMQTDLAAVRARIADGAATGDLEKVRQATHILVSIAGAVGAARLQAMAGEINRLANDGAADEVRGRTAEALTELGRLLDFILEKAGATSE